MSAGPSWADVSRAIAVDDDRLALRLAVAVFGASRSAEASDVVVHLGRRVADAGEQLPKRGPAAFEGMWSAMVTSGDPSVLTTVLAGWGRMPAPVDAVGGAPYVVRRFATHIARCEQIATWPTPDPRIARAAEALLDEPPWSTFSHFDERATLYDPLFALVAMHGDARSIALLGTIADRANVRTLGLRNHLGAQAASVIAELGKKLGRDADLEGLDAVRKALGIETEPTAHDDRDLLDEVFANPDNTALRHVCADWLLEKGNPRGKLLALQLSAERTTETKAIETALVKKHGRTFVGALAAISQRWSFVDGFLDAAELLHSAAASPATWKAAAEARELATIRRLSKGRATEASYGLIAFSPHARSLRDIELGSRTALTKLFEAPSGVATRLESLRVSTLTRPFVNDLEGALSRGILPELSLLEIVVADDKLLPAFDLVAASTVLRGRLTEVRFRPTRTGDEQILATVMARAAELAPISIVSGDAFGRVVRAPPF